MELGEGLLTRRSVRKFVEGKEISKEDRDYILNAAMHAPSARNTQPWEFIVVDDKSIFPSIIANHPYCSFLKDASLAIVVCGNLEEQMAPDYWIADSAAATENLLLACHEKGLGACWCGVFPNEERVTAFKKIFNLPEHIMPLSLIVIGYPEAQPKQPIDRFKPSKIHHNKW